jgi:hypothetical protein
MVSGRSVRRKMIPESGGPGRKVMRTFLPVCSPTPVARIEFLSVLCPTIFLLLVTNLCPAANDRVRCLRDTVLQPYSTVPEAHKKSALPYHRRKSDTNAFPLGSTPPPITSGVQTSNARPTSRLRLVGLTAQKCRNVQQILSLGLRPQAIANSPLTLNRGLIQGCVVAVRQRSPAYHADRRRCP